MRWLRDMTRERSGTRPIFCLPPARGLRAQLPDTGLSLTISIIKKNSITLFDPTKKNQRQSHKLTSRLTRWIFICIKRIIRCFCSIKQRIKVTTFFYLQFLFKIIHHHSHLDVLSIKLYFSNDIRLAFDFHTLIKFCYYMI